MNPNQDRVDLDREKKEQSWKVELLLVFWQVCERCRKECVGLMRDIPIMFLLYFCNLFLVMNGEYMVYFLSRAFSLCFYVWCLQKKDWITEYPVTPVPTHIPSVTKIITCFFGNYGVVLPPAKNNPLSFM